MSSKLSAKVLSRAFWAVLLAASVLVSAPAGSSSFKALVFTKTSAFRHASIPAAVSAIRQLGADNGFQVDHTEDASVFTDSGLSSYSVVVFALTTGDVLDPAQQAALERFVQSGRGFVGVHSAADTEYDWSWYGGLVGAYFQSHPAIQQATINVLDRSNRSTSFLSERWTRTDEWYNYRSNPRGQTHVLMALSESSYGGGSMGADHPIAWCHGYDGGRSWYTGLGHTEATWSDVQFRSHLLGGILFAASGDAKSECGATITSNYDRIVLEDQLSSPTAVTALPDGRVLITERTGIIKIWRPATGSVLAGNLAVDTTGDRGLLGVVADPNFALNQRIYLFYTAPGGSNTVARFEMSGDSLIDSSKRVLLSFQSASSCCHQGGGLQFGDDGSLYITTGDATNPDPSEYSPTDERPGRADYDAQRTSSNDRSFAGKILRITPLEDATYSIPSGNLFPAGGTVGLPEIFAMGMRDPGRPSIDQTSGFVYVADRGPLASADSATRGPRGYDEVNQLRASGNLGWPYCIADNRPYNEFDYALDTSGPQYSCAVGVNDSPNNTGSAATPPSIGSLIAYSNTADPRFGSGGRGVVVGPVYRHDAALSSTSQFPSYHDGTLFIADTNRGSLFETRLADDGGVLAVSPFLKDLELNVIDMVQSSDGSVLVLDRGKNSTDPSLPDSTLLRISYNPNASAPVAVLSESGPTSGPAPLQVNFSAAGSHDPDPGDTLTYSWDFTTDGTADAAGVTASYTYPAGTFKATLRVTDSTGRFRTASLTIRSGIPASNPAAVISTSSPTSGPAPLQVSFSSSGSFDPDGDTISFKWDFEDDGEIDSIDPSPVRTFGPGEYTTRLTVTDSTGRSGSAAISILSGNTRPVVGFLEPRVGAVHSFGERIRYRLSVSDAEDGSIGSGISCSSVKVKVTLQHDAHTHQIDELSGCEGDVLTTAAGHDPDKQSLLTVLIASYIDRGGPQFGPTEGSAGNSLHPVRKQAEAFTSSSGVATRLLGESGPNAGRTAVVNIHSGDWLGFGAVDLAGVKAIGFRASSWFSGGLVEVRKGSTSGELIGEAAIPNTSTSNPYQYREILVPIVESTGASNLYLVFRSFLPGRSVGILDASQELFTLDWVDLLRTQDPPPGVL